MFSYAAEFLSLILLVLLIVHYYDPLCIQSSFGRQYWQCLIVTGASMVLNGLCVLTLPYSSEIPLWINMLLNTFYFAASFLMCELFSLYLLEKLMAHADTPLCLTRARYFIRILYGALFALLFINIPTGVLFFFDEEMHYCRGILNGVGYLQAIIAILLLLVCYCRNRRTVDKGMRRVMRLGVPMVLALITFQQIYPHILLNGTIGVCLAILLFLNFQSEKIDMDPLTGLHNRRSFLAGLEEVMAKKHSVHIVLVSLCHFSAINLAYGYQRGDEILYHIARCLERNFGRKGQVFRFGPVTFLLTLPYQGNEEAERNISAVQQQLSQPWQVGGRLCTVEARVLDLITNGESWTTPWVVECLEYGQVLLKQGQKRYFRFGRAAAAQLWRRRYLTDFIQRAIAEEQFQVWYQPVFCVRTQKFCSAEALVRLQEKDGTFISPMEFVPLSEESGLIDGINHQVMEKVCSFLEKGLPGTLQGVSINLSMNQLSDPRFAQELSDLLKRKNIPVEHLLLEITERMLISEDLSVRENFEQLSKGNFQFFLDDFGTGYSNFSGVLHFPFTTIKLDKSLIQDLDTDQKHRTSVEMLIDMFHRTGFEVVAEGIETGEQAQKLADLGVDFLQGFYYARPMPEDAFIRFMEKNS